MEQYIKKSDVVAEIRKRLLPVIRDKHYDEWEEGKNSERIAILDIINTLEVKEVDLEKEVANWWNDHYKELNDKYEFFGKYNGHYMENSTVISLAKHFFELGLNVRRED